MSVTPNKTYAKSQTFLAHVRIVTLPVVLVSARAEVIVAVKDITAFAGSRVVIRIEPSLSEADLNIDDIE